MSSAPHIAISVRQKAQTKIFAAQTEHKRFTLSPTHPPSMCGVPCPQPRTFSSWWGTEHKRKYLQQIGTCTNGSQTIEPIFDPQFHACRPGDVSWKVFSYMKSIRRKGLPCYILLAFAHPNRYSPFPHFLKICKIHEMLVKNDTFKYANNSLMKDFRGTYIGRYTIFFVVLMYRIGIYLGYVFFLPSFIGPLCIIWIKKDKARSAGICINPSALHHGNCANL